MDIFCFISEGLCTNEDGFVLFFILALAIYYVHMFMNFLQQLQSFCRCLKKIHTTHYAK